MIKRLLILFLICSGCILLSACETEGTKETAEFISYGTSGGDYSTIDYRMVQENDILTLDFCENTSCFRITDKRNGKIYESGCDYAESGRASVILTYIDDSDVSHKLNSFTDAVKKGQFTFEYTDDGIKIKYSLGAVDGKTYGPKIISQERYLKFYEACDKTGQKLLSQIYKAVDISKLEESARASVLEDYPQAADQVIYVQKVDKLQSAMQKKLHAALEKAGYTDEDYEIDKAFSNEAEGEKVAFNVTLIISLKDDHVTVTVPEGDIACTGAVTIQNLSVLPNFSRATYGEEGYYVLPDGSGSVMNFFNGKNDLQEYSVSIYGEEETVKEVEQVYTTQQAILPVFGCHMADDAGWLAVIEEGDALSMVTAAPGDEKTPAYAYATFRVLQYAMINAVHGGGTESDSSYYLIPQDEIRDGNLSVSYYFLDGEASDYSGMASYYRDLLFAGQQELGQCELPLYIETIGSIEITEKRNGIEYSKMLQLTDGEALLRICGDLSDTTGNLFIILSGYADGGYSQEFLDSDDISEELEEALDLLEERGISYSVSYETQYAVPSGLFGGVSSRYISRLLSRGKALIYDTNPAYFNFDEDSVGRYVLNEKGLEITFGNVEKLVLENGLDSVTLLSSGKSLSADYNENKEVERQQMLDYQLRFVQSLCETCDDVVIGTGNAPFAVAADRIVSLPLCSTGYDITDYSIPFAGMVYSGIKHTAGDYLNLSGPDTSDLLHLIENGAAPLAIVGAENCEELRNTEHDELYSINYDYVSSDIKDAYNYVKEALGDDYGTQITDHERLMNNVYAVTFASGNQIILNYNSEAVTLTDGTEIAAKSYFKGVD